MKNEMGAKGEARSELSSSSREPPSPSMSGAVEAARKVMAQAANGDTLDERLELLASAFLKQHEALEKMRARDERNSSLPPWYR
jgi:hypothetical protein